MAGKSALYLAAEYGQYNACRFLLNRGENIYTAKPVFANLLAIAAKNKDEEMFSKVLNDIDEENEAGETAVYIAVEYGQYQACTFIINRGANISTAKQLLPDLLAMVAKEGDEEMLKNVLNAGADLDKENKAGKTALYIGIKYGHYDICKLLISRWANIRTVKPLFADLIAIAVQHEDKDMLRNVFDAGADIDEPNKAGKTALYISAETGHYYACKFMITNGANISTAKPLYANLIAMAVEHYDEDMWRNMLNAGADKDDENKDGETALYIAAYHDHYYACKFLINRGANISTTKQWDVNLLAMAAKQGDEEMFKNILNAGIDIDSDWWPGCGRNAMCIAVKRGQYDTCKFLINRGANISTAKSYFANLLAMAVAHGDEELWSNLLNAGADLNNKNWSKKTALYITAEHGNYDACKFLINQGALIDTAKPMFASLLAMSVEHRDEELWTKLLNAGADIAKENKAGKTALYIAAEHGDYLGCKKILNERGNSNMLDNGLNPLAVAIEFYHFDIVELFVKDNRCNVNKDVQGITPLMIAAKVSYEEIVKLFLSKDADMNKVDKNGVPALGYALKAGNAKIQKMLAKTSHGLEQCVSFICQENIPVDKEVEVFVKKLLSEGEKCSFLETASFYGSPNLLDYLLNKTNEKWDERNISTALKNGILSDNAEACEIIHAYCKKLEIEISNDLRSLVTARGKMNIVKIFGLQVARKKNQKTLVTIPKTKEFMYVDLLTEQILPLVKEASLSSNGLVRFDTFIEKLHVEDIHYSPATCPDACKQQPTCRRIRDVLKLLKDVMKKMGEEYPIFENARIICVGSLKEGTKIGRVDEVDITLSLSDEFERNLIFDEKEQRIKIIRTKREMVQRIEIPNELKSFVTERNGVNWEYCGYFDEKKYFFTFMERFYSIIQS